MDKSNRYELIREVSRKIDSMNKYDSQILGPAFGFAHYTEKQVREYAKGIGITDTYLETVGKEVTD